MRKFLQYTCKIGRVIYRLIDFGLKLLFECVCILILVLYKAANLGRKKSTEKKLAILKRYGDTISRHAKCNTHDYLKETFKREPLSKVYILCTGDDKTSVKRWGRNIIGVDILVPKLKYLHQILPYLARSIRDYIALFQAVSFLNKKKVDYVEVDFPCNVLIRAMRIKFILQAKLVTRVLGNIDLMYAQTEFPAFFPFQLSGRKGHTIHKFYDDLLSLIFFMYCDLVIGVNRNNFEHAISKGADYSKSYLVRIKVDRDIEFYDTTAREDIKCYPKSGRVILLWSRLSKEMMVDKAIYAIAPLIRKYKDLNLVIIGEGAMREELINITVEEDIFSHVYFAGYQSRQFIKSAAAYADLVLSPYGGSALVEAALLKSVVVAFDYEWQSEMIIDGYSGYLVDPRSLENITKKIDECLCDSDIGQVLSDNLYRHAQEIFDANKIESDFRQAYMRLIS